MCTRATSTSACASPTTSPRPSSRPRSPCAPSTPTADEHPAQHSRQPALRPPGMGGARRQQRPVEAERSAGGRQPTVTTDAEAGPPTSSPRPPAATTALRPTAPTAGATLIRTSHPVLGVQTRRPATMSPGATRASSRSSLWPTKTTYSVGDTAHILVTSPFTQANGLLTIERGHLQALPDRQPARRRAHHRREARGWRPAQRLRRPDPAGAGAPARRRARRLGQRASPCAQGYVNLSLDTSGKQLRSACEPQGQGPFKPGTTADDDRAHPRQERQARSRAISRWPWWTRRSTPWPATTTPTCSAPSGASAAWASAPPPASRSGDSSDGYAAAVGRLDGGIAHAGAGAFRPWRTTQQARGPVRRTRSPAAPQKVRTDFRDTAFWTADDDHRAATARHRAGAAARQPDHLAADRAGITGDTLAGRRTSAADGDPAAAAARRSSRAS